MFLFISGLPPSSDPLLPDKSVGDLLSLIPMDSYLDAFRSVTKLQGHFPTYWYPVMKQTQPMYIIKNNKTLL